MYHPQIKKAVAAAIACFLLLAPASAAIIRVDDSAPPGGNGSTWQLAYADLQDALDAAAPGDEIRVAGGTYVPVRMTAPPETRTKAFVMLDAVGLYGGFAGYGAPNPDLRDIDAFVTVLSGDLGGDDGPGFTNRNDNCFHVVFNDGNGLTASSVLDGFTLSGGHADMAWHFNQGGGIFLQSSSPTLNDCTVTDNLAVNAAGVSIVTASPVLNRCTIVDNLATNIGGGMIISNAPATLNDCVIARNEANLGSGLSSFTADSAITGCLFADNIGNRDGAAMHNLNSSPTVTDCAFINNSGGAMLNDLDSEPLLDRCLFLGNSVGTGGGAIANLGSSPTLVGCLVQGNSSDKSGGAIFNHHSDPVITGCTFVGNHAADNGGAVENDFSSPLISNSIFWGNSAGTPTFPNSFHSDSWSAPVVAYCDVEKGYPGTGNIDADPLFAAAVDGDYHLTWSSPCRDAGDNASVIASSDFEGDPRIATGTVDMGADEFHFHLYHVGAVTPGAPLDVKVVGLPGRPVLLALGSGIQNPPQTTPHGTLWLTLPPAKTWRPGAIPATGILTIAASVPAGWPAGSEHPFQALVGPWGGTTSRLTNLLMLTVE